MLFTFQYAFIMKLENFKEEFYVCQANVSNKWKMKRMPIIIFISFILKSLIYYDLRNCKWN